MPDSEALAVWAASPQKKQLASVVFLDADGGQPMETLRLPGAYCVRYAEQFVRGDVSGGSYQCALTLSDPAGWTIAAGGPVRAFVAPAAREHGVPGAAAGAGASGLGNLMLGGAMGAAPVAAVDAATLHAAAWAADRAKALDPTRLAGMYKTYVEEKKCKKKTPQAQANWWGVEGKRGGARFTVEGCLGEAQADKLFAAQGHRKLNHGGQLVGVLDPPRGRGLDGVWENANKPPEFLITETKFTTTPDKAVALSSGGQLSDPWVKAGARLENALGRDEGGKMRRAMRSSGIVGKRLLHVDSDGNLHEYEVDAKGKFDILKPLSKPKS